MVAGTIWLSYVAGQVSEGTNLLIMSQSRGIIVDLIAVTIPPKPLHNNDID